MDSVQLSAFSSQPQIAYGSLTAFALWQMAYGRNSSYTP